MFNNASSLDVIRGMVLSFIVSEWILVRQHIDRINAPTIGFTVFDSHEIGRAAAGNAVTLQDIFLCTNGTLSIDHN